MNDEIKEILSYLKKKENTRRIKCITIEESKRLLDYITNLQQDYDKAMELVNEGVENSYKMLNDYKSRCEKASELLQKYGNGTFDENLLNILQGEDNE